MSIGLILERLDSVKTQGANKWIAKCPSHDDKNPSLALTELSDGRILIKCFAGCGAVEILSKIGLSLGDLFPNGSLGEFRSFERIKEQIQTRKKSDVSNDQIFLMVCELDRKSGKRLSRADLIKEREAFERVRKNAAS